MTCRALALLAAVVLSSQANAATRRLAIVVGHNTGAASREPLRYAESDAGRVARVLVELGEVAPGDVWLVQGGDARSVEQAFTLARAQVEKTRAALGRSVLYFYFSGHSDGEAMELGRERITYASLRDRLNATRADVRLAIVDACKSGSAVLEKGGRPAEAFKLKLVDELTSTGDVFLASSAPDEASLESHEAGGGFFTAHLVSGLRGAADASGDGRVTLSEIYRYVYDRTVTTSATTLGTTQHPIYDYRLSGQGELVLSMVTDGASRLAFGGAERAWVRDLARDQLVAEVPSAQDREVAVAPGAYAVILGRGGETRGVRVEVAKGERRVVSWDQATTIQRTAAVTRGSQEQQLVEPPPNPWVWSIGAGVAAGSAPPSLALRIGGHQGGPRGLTFGVIGNHNANPQSTLNWGALSLRVGYAWRWSWGGLDPFVGFEAGPSLFFDDGNPYPTFLIVPRVGLETALGKHVRAGVTFEAALGAAPLTMLLGSMVEFGYAF